MCPMKYDLASFGRFVRRLKLEDGSTLRLLPFQRDLLRDHFSGTRELVIVIPKKNGKTTLLAALALFHLLVVEEASVIIVAASREQAALMFDQAVGFIRRSDLEDIFAVRSGYREIRLQGPEGPRYKTAGAGASGSRLRVLADANTADGVIPTLALVDELHRHPSNDLYDILRYGLTPRHGKMVTISTAGTKLDSPLGRLRQQAFELPHVNRRGVRINAWNAGRSFVLHEYSLPAGADHTDMELVKQANPAPWHTRATLRTEFRSPSNTPGQWMRYVCNVWTDGDEPAIDPAQWDRLGVDVGHVEPGEDVWMAAHVGDSAWIAIVAHRDQDRVAARVVPVGEDRSGVKTEAKLLELANEYRVIEVAHPRITFMRSAEILASAGLPMVETPYSPQRFAVISSTFIRLINAGLLMHDRDPALRAQVLAATAKETETGWRYVLTPRCAALFALANACHQLTAFVPEPFIGVPSIGVESVW
jgi:hypothetical protein